MSHPYEHLSPDLVLDAVEQAGFLPDGRILSLNSYENRVFQIGIEDHPGLVAKFYRPDRHSDAAILEEHNFSEELAQAEIPVVAPLAIAGNTLHRHQNFRFALFPRRGGRAPEADNLQHLAWIGRFLGRIHLQGRHKKFAHRPAIDVQRFGWHAQQKLLDSGLLPFHLENEYAQLSSSLIEQADRSFTDCPTQQLRLHGDCHIGNILWTEDGPHFVDLDDCGNGPAVADLWMLLSGDREEMQVQLSALLDGYRTFCDFDLTQLQLIEPLRTLRLLHYTSWVAQRWDDPAFPLAFPWMDEAAYWTGYLADLRQQQLRMAEPALRVG